MSTERSRPELAEVRCPRCGRHRLNMRLVPGSLVEASRCRRCRAYLLVLIDADERVTLFTYFSRSGQQYASGGLDPGGGVCK